jgi:hypothetical protein
MKARCLNPRNHAYADYGGRGITVCDRWLGSDGFLNFLEDMGEPGPGLSIDRIDNDGSYESGNCRWATPAEQQRNRRATRLTQADVDWIRSGTGLTQQAMADRLGVGRRCIGRVLDGSRW